RIRSDIEAGELQADSFAEQFTRPYGTVWAGSVLLDISPQKVDPLIKRYAAEIRAKQANLLRLRVGAGAAIAISWLLYLALNAITKGYFTTPLRFGVLAVTVLAVMLMP